MRHQILKGQVIICFVLIYEHKGLMVYKCYSSKTFMKVLIQQMQY